MRTKADIRRPLRIYELRPKYRATTPPDVAARTLERLKQAPASGYYQQGPAQSQFSFERPINNQAVI